MIRSIKLTLICGALVWSVAACQPTVQVKAPDKPIEINMNIKIEQEVRIKTEKDLEKAFANNPDIFGIPTENE